MPCLNSPQRNKGGIIKEKRNWSEQQKIAIGAGGLKNWRKKIMYINVGEPPSPASIGTFLNLYVSSGQEGKSRSSIPEGQLSI